MPAVLSTFFDQKQINNLIQYSAASGHHATAPIVQLRMEGKSGTVVYKGLVHLVITDCLGDASGLVLRCHESLESNALESRYVLLLQESGEWVIKNMIDVVQNPQVENGLVKASLPKLIELGLF